MPSARLGPLVELEPFAVRPKEGMRLAGCGESEFYKRINAGRYESFLDGTSRMITVRSIRSDQEKLLAEARGTPREKPSKRAGFRDGRPRKVTVE